MIYNLGVIFKLITIEQINFIAFHKNIIYYEKKINIICKLIKNNKSSSYFL